MEKHKIVVIGSSNTDMVIQSQYLPKPGETVLGGQFVMNPGGKGANQAVAATKLGGEVTFIAKIGKDIFGETASKNFQLTGIDTSFIEIDEQTASGIALILVDDKGENCISVALGANAAMTTATIDKATSIIQEAAFVLIQLEIPLDVVIYAIQMASKQNARVILNPAPAQELPELIYPLIYILTPNETEASLLTGVDIINVATARQAAQMLREKGVEIVLITMGEKGAYLLSAEQDELIPCPRVQAVDSTAAGDTFNGALVVGLTEGMTLAESIVFANKAAAISVTRLGAQASIPTRDEVN